MIKLPLPLAPALLAAALAACTAAPPALIVERLPAAEGTAVPLGKAVEVGKVVVEPLRVIEDSRCPINARCVWAGRLVVETNVAGYQWGEIVPLTLGEPYTTHGTTLALVSGEPGRVAGDGKETPKEAYRFTFEAR